MGFHFIGKTNDSLGKGRFDYNRSVTGIKILPHRLGAAKEVKR